MFNSKEHNAQEAQQTTVDLRKKTYDLLHLVREPSTTEREAMEGFVFLTVKRIKLLEVVPNYFGIGQLDYINQRPELRDYEPPVEIHVAVNPHALWVPGSFNKSRAGQLAITDTHSKSKVEPLSSHAKAVMLPATAIFQLDRAYQKEKGEALIRKALVRTLDNTSEVMAAHIGRSKNRGQLHLGEWSASYSRHNLGVLQTVVFV